MILINHLKFELLVYTTPMMRPKSPKAEPKISMTRSLMKVYGSFESDNAIPLPATPTLIPQTKFDSPTVIPTAK